MNEICNALDKVFNLCCTIISIMDQEPRKFFSSKVSIVGLFATLTIILTIPLAILLSQKSQILLQHAAEPTISPNPQPMSQVSGYIGGYVFLDQNQNGQREPGEMPVPDAGIKITQLNANGSGDDRSNVARTATELKTDSNG